MAWLGCLESLSVVAAAVYDGCYDGEDYLRLVIDSLMRLLGAAPGPLIISAYCPAHATVIKASTEMRSAISAG